MSPTVGLGIVHFLTWIHKDFSIQGNCHNAARDASTTEDLARREVDNVYTYKTFADFVENPGAVCYHREGQVQNHLWVTPDRKRLVCVHCSKRWKTET